MQRKRRWLLLIGAPIILLLAAVVFLGARSAPDSNLVTAPVTVGDLEQTVLASGKLRPKELVSVGAQVSGHLRRLHVALGQRVGAGDLIAEIDAEPQRIALRNAEAAVASLRAQHASRRESLVQAELAFQRQQALLSTDATAAADYEAARATLGTAREDVKSLVAQIAQARTQVDTARINLGYTRIVAPMDGVIVAVVTKQGQTLNSFQSAPTIVMLAKLDVMTVRAEIAEADIANVRPGQTAWFTTLGDPDQRHYARIETIEPAPESIANEASTSGAPASISSSGSTSAIYYNALFDVPNPDGRLRPSMTAQVSVLLSRVTRAVIVPTAALGARDTQGNYAVRVVDDHGGITTRKVEIGTSTNAAAVVIAGLKPGERVVIGDAASAAGDGPRGM
jgi:macrolide-specific efflux system membrane fusion protein